jgi:predicted permease
MPEWKAEVRRQLKGLNLPPAREEEIIEELSDHLENLYEEILAQGATTEKAYREVHSSLKQSDLLVELRAAVRTARPEPIPVGSRNSGHLLADLWQDLVYAARMLRNAPGFTAVAALTLALGIGANTAVFTIISTLLLNPLPVANSSELAAINTTQAKMTTQSGEFQLMSYLNIKDFRDRTHSFSSFAAHSNPTAITMTDTGEPHRVFVELVSGNYFETLGIHPFMGRFFLPSEDVTPGAAPVVVLGYAAWQGRFGGASDIVGRTIKLNNTPFTIIGIGPKGFKGLYAVFGPDVWVPSMMAEQILPAEQGNALRDRAILLFTGIARLRPGLTIAQARAELNIVASSLEKEFPDANQGQAVAVRPLNEAAYGPERQPLLFGSTLLMAIVGLVLLIACSNVANLLLSRAAVRRQEMAVRLALGAGRMRLIRQLLTESVLLGLLGGGLGLLFGYAGCQFLWSFRPAEFALNFAELRISPGVFVFALAVSLLSGLLFGVVPALRTSRTPVSEVLKEESRAAGRSRGRISLANTLLAGQVAVSLVLLVVAAMVLQSIQREYTIDPGFETKHVALFMMYPGQAGYNQTRTEQFYKQARERIGSVPGISSLSWASNLPLWGRKETGVVIEGQEQRKKSEAISAVVDTVDLNYFSTVGISFVEGRDFTQEDRDISTPIAIINDTMAAKYWPNQSPLGKRLQLPRGKDFVQIVGVVKTANYQTLGEAPQSCVYLPLRQNYSDAMILYVRTERDPSATLAAVQGEIRILDPGLPVEDIRTGTKVIEQALWGAKIGVGLLGVFGLLALALASVGLYGIMAYSVNQRRREIGIRMALGAGQASVLRLILRQGMLLVISGVALGLIFSLLIGRALSKFLYGVGASDAASLAGASLVLLSVALVACYLPARRASQVDPLVALHES